jgi:transcriptional regulator with XRE-family HTH domain
MILSKMPFAPDRAQRILSAIESGLTLRETAEIEGISSSLIMKYAREDESFGNQYARSMLLRTDLDFEKLVDSVEEEPERTERGIDMAWVQRKRLQVDTIKWALSKRNPKKYGDRMHLDGDVTLSLADSIREARQRALEEDKTLQLGDGSAPDGLSDGRDQQ